MIRFLWLLSLPLIIQSCGSESSEIWTIEWRLLNSADSLPISPPISYKLEVDHQRYNPPFHNDTFTSEGYLIGNFSTGGSSDYVSEFPQSAKLHALITKDSNVLLDTIFTWGDLGFTRGYSRLYKAEVPSLSAKVLYIGNK